MDYDQNIALIDAQIDAAKGGDVNDLTDWKNETEVILRTMLGQEHPTYKKVTKTKFTPGVFYDGMSDSIRVNARRTGIRNVVSALKSLKTELGLLEHVKPPASKDVEVTAEQPLPGGPIFIVHGHDEANKQSLARFLRNLTKVEPTILHEVPNKGRVLIEKFEQSAAVASYAVILLTADDLGNAIAEAESSLNPRGRQNVVFEMGYFIGALGRANVAVLYQEDVELPGDTNGLVYVPLDKHGGWKGKIAREVEAAGITVDWSAIGK